LPIANGGTNTTSVPANGQLLIGNGTDYTVANLTAGTGVTITNTAGGITLSAPDNGTVTGVTASSPLASSGGTAPDISLTGTVPVGNGGTGATTLTGYVIGNGTSAMTASTTIPTSNLTGTLPVANGGTGQTTYTDGQLLIGNTTGSTLAKATLTAGTGVTITNGPGTITISAPDTGTVTAVTASSPLASSGGAAPNLSLTGTVAIANGGTAGTATPTAGAVPYGTGTAYAFSAAGTTGQVLTSAGAGAPTWTTPTTGTVTSVTASSPLASSGGATPNLTLGTVPVANGGTNATATPTAGAIAYGTGSAYAFSLAGTTGQVLTSNGASAPTWAAAATGTVTSVAQSFTGGLISVAGSPITSSGTLALTVAGTSGGVPYFSSGTSWASTAAGTTGQFLKSNGSGAPTWADAYGPVYTKTTFTATAGQTTFTVAYTVGYIDVYLNGVKLTTSEYTATNGTSVVLGTAAALNDVVETIAWTVWSATNTAIGVGTGTSLALNGATLGSNALAVAGTETITSASANAFAVGRQGTTNPVLNVDASTASVVTGLNLKGAAAAGGMAMSVTSSGTNENLTFDAKGTGTITLNGTATGKVVARGTATNDDAAAGYIGEVLTALLSYASRVTVTSAAAKTVTSLSLTAGDWEVDGIVFYNCGSSETIQLIASCVSQTNNTFDNTLTTSGNRGVYKDDIRDGVYFDSNDFHTQPISLRVSLSSTTTIYLIALSYHSGTMSAHGGLFARRMR
jgi:hypothetical protein